MGKCEDVASAMLAAAAEACARWPYRAIVANVLLALICGVGLVRLEVETKGDRLWVSQESNLKKQMEYVEDVYSPQARVNYLTMTTNPSGADVLTAKNFAQLFDLHDSIMALKTSDGFGWTDVCERDAFGGCYVDGALAFFSTPQGDINRSLFQANATTAAVKARLAPPLTESSWLLPTGKTVDVNGCFMCEPSI
eukprot:SAG31_NODE_4328_length_3351_cov_1.759225_4_plen_195_part_00